MTTYGKNLERTLGSKGDVSSETTRGAESWQFFVRLRGSSDARLRVLDDLDIARWSRIVLKVLSFLAIGYLILRNDHVKNRLVGLLGKFNKERR
jgi:hypothetical protein